MNNKKFNKLTSELRRVANNDVYVKARITVNEEPLSLSIADDGFLMSETEETITVQFQWERTVKA